MCKLTGTAGFRTARHEILHTLYESNIRYRVQEIPQMDPAASYISVTHLWTSFLPSVPLLSWSIFPLVFPAKILFASSVLLLSSGQSANAPDAPQP
jgi:hypothetical protein